MRITDLDYVLPEELIAQEPLAERDASRLLLLDVPTSSVEDHRFTELPHLLPPSLFVFNDTRVFPARLFGHKASGGRVELLLLRKATEGQDRWLAMGRSSKGLREGMELALCDGRLTARVRRVLEHGQLEVDLSSRAEVDRVIEEAGEVPLPPYIRRAALESDRGPVQADTLDEHEMHEEAYQIPDTTVAAIKRAREEGRPVAAVGTTVVRTLESCVDDDGMPSAGVGATRLFIRPPYHFRVVDHLVTNFHLPRSTLLALVMAFAGTELTRDGYHHAAEQRYRFYSYGDAMLIRKALR